MSCENAFLWCMFMLQMHVHLAVFMCNLKASKMRGIFSEGMIMCAKDGKVEILEPPPGVAPGDRVTCEGYTGKLQVSHWSDPTPSSMHAPHSGLPWTQKLGSFGCMTLRFLDRGSLWPSLKISTGNAAFSTARNLSLSYCQCSDLIMFRNIFISFYARVFQSHFMFKVFWSHLTFTCFSPISCSAMWHSR